MKKDRLCRENITTAEELSHDDNTCDENIFTLTVSNVVATAVESPNWVVSFTVEG